MPVRTTADGMPIEVRRSARRRKTVQAFTEGGHLVVAIPARFSAAEEDRWVRHMAERVDRRRRRRRPSDADLERRAGDLARRYLPGAPAPESIAWVSNQDSRWGSCTPAQRTIRISDRVRGMPEWVLDYVLLHELAHLVAPGHDRRFWNLVERYPHTARARGFLEGVTHAQAEGTAP